MNKTLRLLSSAAVLATAMMASAEIPLDYYTSLDGLKGAELKNAIHQLVAKSPEIKMLDYGSGTNKTWWAFYVTDRREDNTCVDRYSYETFYFGDRGASITGTNIEHSFPKSWWGGTNNNAYKDLFNLMPCESSINQSKSNYPMGVVTKVTTAAGDNGCTKVGSGPYGSSKFWEPADQWKGDFARGYMYMATAYQDFTWTGEGLNMLQQDEWPTLQPWAYNLFLQWARQDDVAEIEVVRCNRVQEFQHNRNPYVDFPNLMEYVWGDSINTPFNLLTTRKSDSCAGYLYKSSFLGETGGCTISTAVNPGITVWSNSDTYGWTAKAARGTGSNITCYASDASLVLPTLDLSSYNKVTMSFEHAVNYAASPADVLHVYVRDQAGTLHSLNDQITWPAGSGWTFVTSGSIDLSEFGGQKVQIEFRYTSTTSEACTWEIKNVNILGSIREINPEDFQTGDLNFDGQVDMSDVAALINIVTGTTPDKTKGAADLNSDGEVDMSDSATLINIILGLVSPGPVPGDGTQDSPYLCSQIIAMNPSSTSEASATGVWVEGYIVGYYSSYKCYFNLDETPVNHNILISDKAGTTDKVTCIDVQLVNKSAVRTALNLVDNPDMLGKKVRLYGDIYKYNQMPGMKNTSKYILP